MGGETYTWSHESLITLASPQPGVYSLSVAAGDGSNCSRPDAAYTVRIHAVTPTVLTFDGGVRPTSQPANEWRYYRVDVPADSQVLGWDLRLSGVTAGYPQMVVRRDALPGSVYSSVYSTIYGFSTTWPSGSQWAGVLDWSGYSMEADGRQAGSVLTMGMGNPLEPGTYYVGVYASSGEGCSYTLSSRGIGAGQSIGVVDLGFAGSIEAPALAPRQAAYYRVEVPAGKSSWKLKLTPSGGQALLLVHKGFVPSSLASFHGQPSSWVWNGSGYTTGPTGGRMQNTPGNEFFTLLPEYWVSEQVPAGVYYVAVVSEGTDPGLGRVGAGAVAYTLSSLGELPVTDLGTVGTEDLVRTQGLEHGEMASYRFEVPPGTLSVEVRLENVTGKPRMTLQRTQRLVEGLWQYCNSGGGSVGGETYTWSHESLITLASPQPGVYSLSVAAGDVWSNCSRPDAGLVLRVRETPSVDLAFSSELNEGDTVNVVSGVLADAQRAYYRVQVPATVADLPVLGWKLELLQNSGTPWVRVRKDQRPADGDGASSPFVTGAAMVAPPWLTPGTWYVEVKGQGNTAFTLTSSALTTATLRRLPWAMPAAGQELAVPGLSAPVFGDTGYEPDGTPLPGDQGIDLEQGRFHYYGIEVPPGNAGLLRTELQAISGNPNLYLQAGSAPTISHYTQGASGGLSFDRSLTRQAHTEYGNWVPLDGRFQTQLSSGLWVVAVHAAGSSNVRYRLRLSSGNPVAGGLVQSIEPGGSLFANQNLAGRDWRYYRFTANAAGPANWLVTFSRTLGGARLYFRDTAPPGDPATTYDQDYYIEPYRYERDWYSDNKNQGPYPLFGTPGSYTLTTPPLRPGHTYYVGVWSPDDTTFTLAIAPDASGPAIPAATSLAFQNGSVTDILPGNGSALFAVDVPAAATRWRHVGTHSSAVRVTLEQGTIPQATGGAHWRSTGENSSLDTPLSMSAWPNQPGHKYYLLVSNLSGAPEPFTLTLEGTVPVQRLPQTIAFDPIANHTNGDPPSAITATASSGLPVTFNSLTPQVATVSGNTVTIVAPGTATIRASQPGDASYLRAPDVDRSFMVAQAPPRVANPIAGFAVNEDSADTAIDLRAVFDDLETADADLIYALEVNSNPGLVSAAVDNTSDTLTLHYAPNRFGTATLTVRATDAGGFVVDDTFVVTVNRLHDGDPGDVDTGLMASLNGAAYSLAPQANGQTVIGGGFTTVNSTPRNRIARLNADGTLDSNFNPGADNAVFTTAVQADGKIVLGGLFTTLANTARNRIGRLNADGTLDLGFNPDASSGVRTLALQPDGNIVVGGDFTLLGGSPRARIARLSGSGILDPAFNPNATANGGVRSMAVQADGKIVLGGDFSAVNGTSRNGIARLHADGTLDTGFNPNANGSAISLLVRPDGKILIAGTFTTVGGTSRNRLALLNPDGALDSSFNPGADNIVWSTVLQADGKLLVAGSFTTLAGGPRNRIGRLNADGTLDVDFRPEANNTVWSAALMADGKVQIGGDFNQVGGQSHPSFARLANDAATQNLSVADPDRVEWLRGGASPEAQAVTFEVSTDGGATWSPLGAGERIGGGWEKTGLNLSGQGQVRARARVAGGLYAGSSGLVEAMASFVFNSAPIVAQPIANQTATYGAAFSFTVPANTFSDVDAGQTLTYTASGLPAWLSFDANTATFAGTPTDLGSSTLTVTATDSGWPPLSVSTSFDVVVEKAAQTIAFGPLPARVYGDAPFAVSATSSSGLPVSFASLTPSVAAVSGNTVTILAAGTATLAAYQSGDALYLPATPVTQTLTVAKADPVVTWAQPADINCRTVLGTAQLNATANVPGTLTYSPPAGTTLGTGDGQPLSVTFVPADNVNYNTVSATTTIRVRLDAWASVAWQQPNPYGRAAIAQAADGNVIVTGLAWNGSNWDFSTVKYAAATGAVLWETRYTGPANGSDEPRALAVDAAGDVVVTGISRNSSVSSSVYSDFYTAKYAAANGALLWERRYNGPANDSDQPNALAVDPAGNVVVIGTSKNLPDWDSYTVKYAAATGAVLWERRGPANLHDYGVGVALDGQGNVLTLGTAYNSSGNTDIRVAKHAAADGALLWEQRYDGPAHSWDDATAIALDSAGNAIVTGYVVTATIPALKYEAYTAKYAAANGALLWSQRSDGPSHLGSYGLAVQVDAAGNAIVAANSSNGGSHDYHTAKYAAADGAVLWERQLANRLGYLEGRPRLALDAAGDVFFAGMIKNADDSREAYTASYASASGALRWEHRAPTSGNVTRPIVVNAAGQVATTGVATVLFLEGTRPALTLEGPQAMTLAYGMPFTDPGATATDGCGSALSVTVAGTVDASTPGTYTLAYSATDAAGQTVTAIRTVTVSVGPPVLTALSPATALAGPGGLVLNVAGARFQLGARVRWNGLPRDTEFLDDAHLRATLIAGDLNTTQPIATVLVTVSNADGQESNPMAFTVLAPSVGPVDSAVALAGSTASVATPPASSDQAGVAVTVENHAVTGAGSEPVCVVAATYNSAPVGGTAFQVADGSFVDVQITGADASDRAAVYFYYPATITGAQEDDLKLRFFDGADWVPVESSRRLLSGELSSTPVPPLKDTTDNLDETVSGGRFTVVFDDTSRPMITELSGTVFGMFNPAPQIHRVSGPLEPVALGTATPIAVEYVALGSWGAVRVAFDWGDGTHDTVAPSALGFASAAHRYFVPGRYAVAIRVTDEAGESSEESFSVVYDSRPGFVTGGGWISSPSGAYVPNERLAGKANFGFVSKYEPGAGVPTGNVEFHFAGAGFRFTSTGYNWLLVTRTRAQCLGVGVINGVGDYGFLLTATGGEGKRGGDKFRMRIWERTTGRVVYDNGLGGPDDLERAAPQAIGGGSIVVHNAN
ncbi:MAG: DUF5011 domain-containing protein [Verrucomicrobia bacterium]|nr:DUF5011 domain-containing protein [Verrucomicrobiota bacterium]